MSDYDSTVKNLREAAKGLLFDAMPYRASVMRDAADAIDELLDELTTIRKQLPHWISVEERLPERTNPMHARDTFLVRLESGHIMTLSYEYDNSDRCAPGMVPLFDEGWEKTVVPVTHWMPLPAPPTELKEETDT